MSEKKLTRLPSDEDWDDDNGPFVEAESHLVRVASKRGRSSKRCTNTDTPHTHSVVVQHITMHRQIILFMARCCLFVIPTFIVIALLVLGAVITGVVLSTSRSGRLFRSYREGQSGLLNGAHHKLSSRKVWSHSY